MQSTEVVYAKEPDLQFLSCATTNITVCIVNFNDFQYFPLKMHDYRIGQ